MNKKEYVEYTCVYESVLYIDKGEIFFYIFHTYTCVDAFIYIKIILFPSHFAYSSFMIFTVTK